jgi:uncharacterized membrane protein YjfL (UPF0719 family)
MFDFGPNIFWHLPVLLVVVSFVYSATRHDRWDRIVKEGLGWVLRMGGFLGGLGVLLYVLSSWPKLWPYAVTAIVIGGIVYYAITSPLFKKSKTEETAKPPTKTS